MGLKDKLITVAALWLSITLAALPMFLFDHEALATQIGSLVVLFVLVTLYAMGTAPGQRTGAATYLIAGIICPVVPYVTLVIETTYVFGDIGWIERWLFAPYMVGIPGPHHGDVIFDDRVFASFPNIFLPILAAVLIRAFWPPMRDD